MKETDTIAHPVVEFIWNLWPIRFFIVPPQIMLILNVWYFPLAWLGIPIVFVWDLITSIPNASLTMLLSYPYWFFTSFTMMDQFVWNWFLLTLDLICLNPITGPFAYAFFNGSISFGLLFIVIAFVLILFIDPSVIGLGLLKELEGWHWVGWIGDDFY
jgi:hypothetical protein